MVKLSLGTGIVTKPEGEEGEILLWLDNEFAKELTKAAIDKGVSSVAYNNIEDPEIGIVSIFDDEIDNVIECEIKIKKTEVKDLLK